MSPFNPYRDPQVIQRLLAQTHTIAVVGLSSDETRAGYYVPAYLQLQGYRIIPVNPNASEILGERCYPDLASVPAVAEIDIVDVFRRSEAVPEILEQAIARGVHALWLQLGVSHAEAERQASDAGLEVVSNHCIKIEHRARRDQLQARKR